MTRNVVAMGMAQVVTWSCTTLLVVLLPRYLGDAYFGKLALALFLGNVVSLGLDLGANSYMTREIARKDNASEIAHYTFSGIL